MKRKNAVTPETRFTPAVRQEAYPKKKLSTHIRRHGWVPKGKVDDFKSTMKRLYKKWATNA